jgi:predicted protein (fragment)
MDQQPYTNPPQPATAPQYSKGQLAVARANMPSDNTVLAVTFIGFFFMTSAYFIFTALADHFHAEETSVMTEQVPLWLRLIIALFSGAILFGVILLVGMFFIRMERQKMLGNAMQVEYSDYAWLRDWANVTAADLGLPRVEIFVTQNPVINAYAFGFMNPYCIVLHSGSIRYLTPDELKTVVIHEMGHIKYKHTIAMLYLQPFLALPFVSSVSGWLAGFWQRRTEYTADRLALTYTEDPELVKNALVKVHVGPDVAEGMNETARQWQRYTANRPMNRFAQTLSDHPYLVRRLDHIDEMTTKLLTPQAPAAPTQPTTPAQPR